MALNAQVAHELGSNRWRPGPVTSRRLRATQLLYATVCIAGASCFFLGASSSWQALGLGLLLPGAGFLAWGPWGLVLLLFTVALFLVALFAWFAAGAIVLPLFIWVGTAVIAAFMAPETSWVVAPYLAVGSCAAVGAIMYRRNHRRRAADVISFRQRQALLPTALKAARERAADPASPDSRELSNEELANARYLLDRALQPIKEFNGFDSIDIFQTAAIRYQINFLGYGLSLLQRHYTPNFHGYLSLAQRNAIHKYLERRVWNYWIYESAWGHLNLSNWDPAAKDNIMLTGYLGAQVALYCGNTGDTQFEKPGSLTFRLSKGKAWFHDVHSITRSVVENYHRSEYCLYPCEPNWIYAGCNFRGMTTLAAYDRAFGTNHVTSVRDRFLAQLDSEFTNAAGGVVGLRSSLTGIEFPFPSSDLGYCLTANTFAPERAERMWALVQFGLRRILGRQNGKQILTLPDAGIDFGNYKRGSLTFAMGALLHAAREFGDVELADAAIATLDERCKRVESKGVQHFAAGSNLANLYIAAARFMRRGDYREGFTNAMPVAVRTGPLLSEAVYPDVLVARAISNGVDLDLVLVPGVQTNSPQEIGLSRLRCDHLYDVEGRPDLSFKSDNGGKAQIRFTLPSRTRLRIVPKST